MYERFKSCIPYPHVRELNFTGKSERTTYQLKSLKFVRMKTIGWKPPRPKKLNFYGQEPSNGVPTNLISSFGSN